ncbi:MAG: protein kinase [Kofleriaceae bacterium]
MTPLAAGGMARIYIARTTGIGSFERHVVLKLITPERANDATAVTMFLDEARLAASLNHQNVAQVFEVGEDAGIHYLAMEYVHGQDLRALLAKAGSQGTRVPLELALTVVAGAAAGLNHAHERRGPDGVPLGIVHRDVSPSNIMIGLDGSVKLLDFGIAKAAARSIETQSGIIKGKFAYMSPEQCRGRDVDRRSDVFSIGIILYEVSTQHRCFRADSDFDTMHRIVTGDVLRPTRLVQGYPQALEAIVLKALAVDANQRYQSAGALLEALESFAMSARMSLSTMALGRFMRDMFGEAQEPWLTTAGRNSQPLPPKESTISNTNGSSERAAVPSAVQRSAAMPAQAVAEPASTLLDLPRGETEREKPTAEDWNAKSYPTMQPSYTASAGSHGNAVAYAESRKSAQIQAAIATPIPGVSPLVTAPQFATSPGSGSGPSHPSLPAIPVLAGLPIVSTRHGYASAPGMSRSELAYPRYEPPASDDDAVQLKPNRRPLVIGLAIVLAGLAVLLVISLSKNDVVKKVDSSGSDGVIADPNAGERGAMPIAAGGSVDARAIEQGSGSAVDDSENSISIHVISDPPGADVLIAGKPIGTTPLDIKYPRGSRQVMLVVHKASFVDVETRIDLAGDFSKNVTLLKEEPTELQAPKAPKAAKEKILEPENTGSAAKQTGIKPGKPGKPDRPDRPDRPDKPKTAATKPGTTKPVAKDPVVKSGSGSATKAATPAPTAGSGSAKPKDSKPNCQPADNVQPWDNRPVCKT